MALLALTLAGAGRGFAAAELTPTTVTIGGVVIQICATNDGAGDTQNVHHQACCDHCTLNVALDMPAADGQITPRAYTVIIRSETRAYATPPLARMRLPHLSRGPPAA